MKKFIIPVLMLFVVACQPKSSDDVLVVDTKSAAKYSSTVDTVSYMIGQNVGNSLRTQGGLDTLLTRDLFFRGLLDAYMQKESGIKKEEGEFAVRSFFMKLEEEFRQKQSAEMEKQSAELKVQYKDVIEAGEKFLAENKAKAGVVTTATGLQYSIVKAGKGAIPTQADKVKVHYRGTLIDGTEFDSSIGKDPVEFQVTGVIAGWTEALLLMPVGSKWQLFVPQELAYGEMQRGEQIKPYSTLVFEIELLEIVK